MLGPAGTALDVDAGRSRASLVNSPCVADDFDVEVTAHDVKATARDISIAQWAVAALVMVGSAAAASITFSNLGEHWWLGLATALGVDTALAMWLLVSRRLRALGLTSPMGMLLEIVAALMTLFLNAGSAAFRGITGKAAQYLLAFAHCFLPVILVLVGLAGAEAQLKLFRLHRKAKAKERAAEAARLAEDRARYDAEQRERQQKEEAKQAEVQQIRNEQAAERKAEQDRVNVIREAEMKTRQAEAEAAAAAEQTALAEAEAALAAAKAEADKQETARLRAEARAAGQGGGRKGGQPGGQRGGQRRGQAGAPGADRQPGPDVSDLMDAGRTVARNLANSDQKLTRSALVSGLRSAGLSCSTDRAIALLSALQSERTDDDASASSEPGERPKLTLAGGGH